MTFYIDLTAESYTHRIASILLILVYDMMSYSFLGVHYIGLINHENSWHKRPTITDHADIYY